MSTWGTHGGASLFPLQLAIAMRGVNLLKVRIQKERKRKRKRKRK
jgi:hypothetical protein